MYHNRLHFIFSVTITLFLVKTPLKHKLAYRANFGFLHIDGQRNKNNNKTKTVNFFKPFISFLCNNTIIITKITENFY